MAEHSKIEWTDATWNPITGCSVVSPGCTNCYAMKLAGSRLRHHPSRVGLTRDTTAGPVWTGDVRLNEEWLLQPVEWSRPRMIFVCAHGDLFHENVPDEWIDRVFAVMALAHQHTFQVLTKRTERMRRYLTHWPHGMARVHHVAVAAFHFLKPSHRDGWSSHDPEFKRAREAVNSDRWPLPNIWLGASTEDQRRANERMADLVATPTAVRFVSYEPALGPIDFSPWIDSLDQIIFGGESGRNARPAHPQWARAVRDLCQERGKAYFHKQWGEWMAVSSLPPGVETGCKGFTRTYGDLFHRVGKKAAGAMLDGREWREFPA